jgi:thiol-disulfide isomerase/thioredoxin
MTEPQETPTPTPEDFAHVRVLARRLILPHAIVVALIVSGALWFVLYGMKGGGSKESPVAGQCSLSKTIAERLAPLAKDDIAAFSVAATPKPAPALAFTGGNGPTDLAAFKGKTILLNLWATWCVPCREEMPALDRLQGEAGNEAFAVVTVNIDTARLERPKAFLQEIGVENLAFYADSTAKIFQTLQQQGIALGLPTTLLIGPDGCEIGHMAGPAKWDGPDALAFARAATVSK